MKLSSFVMGGLLGLSVSILFEAYQMASIPYKRGDIVAGLLLRDLERIEECTSRQNAITNAYLLANQFTKELPWGEMLPPIVNEDTITLRIRKPFFNNVYCVIEGTAKLPLAPDENN